VVQGFVWGNHDVFSVHKHNCIQLI
jgi:hypothetical protein